MMSPELMLFTKLLSESAWQVRNLPFADVKVGKRTEKQLKEFRQQRLISFQIFDLKKNFKKIVDVENFQVGNRRKIYERSSVEGFLLTPQS